MENKIKLEKPKNDLGFFILLTLILAWLTAILTGCSSYGGDFHIGYTPVQKSDLHWGLDQVIDDNARLDSYEKPLVSNSSKKGYQNY